MASPARPAGSVSASCSTPPRPAALMALGAEHDLEIDPASIPELVARDGLRMP
jgi:hypothetical protein